MAAMLRDSVVVVVVVVVRTRPRAIPLAMITKRKWIHEFPLISHDANGAPLGSSAIKQYEHICGSYGYNSHKEKNNRSNDRCKEHNFKTW